MTESNTTQANSTQNNNYKTSEAEQQAWEYFSYLYSWKKPKDIKAGLASGTKSFTKGIFAGVAGFFCSPILGAMENGLVGGIGGFAAGTAGVVVFPTCGAVTAVVQVTRGILNQGEAFYKGAYLGKVWNQESREWQDKQTQALILDSPQFQKQRSQWEARVDQGDVQDDKEEYYQLLQVPKDATETQIRKQYYFLARQYHPDKNPDNPQANVKFQKLGEAYQILSNPSKRAQYDKYGMNAVNDTQFMDQAEFFNMLFGSDKFEPLIGELVLTTSAKMGSELSEEQLKKSQVERQQAVLKQLLQWLEIYTNGQEEQFKAMIQSQAQEWINCNFGSIILLTISKIYTRQAEIYGGTFLEGSIARFKSKGDVMRSQINAFGKLMEVFKSELKMQQDLAQLEQQYNQQQEQRNKEGMGEQMNLEQSEWRSYYEEKNNKQNNNAQYQDDDKFQSSGSCMNGTQSNGDQGLDTENSKQKMDYLVQKAKLEEARLPIMIEAMWAANAIDIESTLKLVCMQLFQQERNSSAKKSLASALKVFAEILNNSITAHNQSKKKLEATQDIKKYIEKAMEGVVQRRQYQEDQQQNNYGTQNEGFQ